MTEALIRAFFFLIFIILEVNSAVIAAEHPLTDEQEIAGLTDTYANERIQDAYRIIGENAPHAEELWYRKTSKDDQRLKEYYVNILNAALCVVCPAFTHYAWILQNNRFKSLNKNIYWSIASLYKRPIQMCWGPPEKAVSAEHAEQLAPEEKDLLKMHLKLRFPDRIPEVSCFMPAPPHILLPRLVGCIGHELGHVLNQYEKDRNTAYEHSSSLWSRVTIMASIKYTPMILSGVLMLMHIGDKLSARRYLSTIGLIIGLDRIANRLHTVAQLRAVSHHHEHAADAAALRLVPKSMRYGLMVNSIERLCNEYYSGTHNFWPTCKSWMKGMTIPHFDTHPSRLTRINTIINLILAAAKSDQRTMALTQLEDAAYATLAHYPRAYRNVDAAVLAAHKAQRDVAQIFTAIRKQHKLACVV